MNFVQYQFAVLFSCVLLVYWVIRDVRWQNAVILVASAVFYGWFVPWWVLLLYCATGVDFVMAQLMHRSPARRTTWLVISLTTNLSILFYFKYFNFFLANVNLGLQAVGAQSLLPTLAIALPAGLSFYTFQTISYTVDVYRGVLRPRTSLLNYISYVSFFPQLVAGPIERAVDLLPQIERCRPFSLANVHHGVQLIMWGLFKKVVLADSAAMYIDKVFVLDQPQTPLVYLSALGFMVQLYMDFSAYTDLARGVARILGVNLVLNFNEPHRAVTVVEFWQRWHISLSTWIRDYLLTPIVERMGTPTPLKLAAASLLTMTLMGLWHGASWNFVVTGIFQGLCIATTQLFQAAAPERLRNMPGGRPLAWLFNWAVVMPSSALLFREHDLTRVLRLFGQNPFVASEMQWRAAVTVGVLVMVMGILPTLGESLVRNVLAPRMEGRPWALLVESVAWSVMGMFIVLFYRMSTMDFVYFQF
jgi:alginate O-acetyltransferase complex protein AlgI